MGAPEARAQAAGWAKRRRKVDSSWRLYHPELRPLVGVRVSSGEDPQILPQVMGALGNTGVRTRWREKRALANSELEDT